MYFNSSKHTPKGSPTLFAMYPEPQNTPLQFFVYFLALIASVLCAGSVFVALWELFVLPALGRQLLLTEAVGAVITVRILFGNSAETESNMTWALIQNRLLDWTLRPLVALAVGAIVYAFV